MWITVIALFPLASIGDGMQLFDPSDEGGVHATMDDNALSILRGRGHVLEISPNTKSTGALSVILWDELGSGRPPSPDPKLVPADQGSGNSQFNAVDFNP